VAEAAAARLFRNVQVQSRIGELQAAAARRSEITVDDLVAELDVMLKLARDTKNPSAPPMAICAHR
jgi:hypothetical protein